MTRSAFTYLIKPILTTFLFFATFVPSQAQAPDASAKTINPNLTEWRRKAELGDVEASHLLGHALLTGEGVAVDPKEAVRWLQLASDKGHAMAQLTLGLLFDEGGPVPADKSKALEFYRKAAEQNIKEAQFNLGLSYATGEGVAKDLEEAARWFLKSAENWDPNAQLQLGLAYLGGKGVKASKEEAVKWLRRSAYQANVDAQFQLGVIVHSGASGDTQEEAIKWLERAAANSHVDAMAFLGGLYARGDGVAKKPEKALEHLSNAAKQGHPRAEYELGLCFLNGEGVVQNDAQSFYWFQLSANHGDPDAQLQTATMLAKGRGTALDKGLSARWLRMAASHGNAIAIAQLHQTAQPPNGPSQVVLAPSESMPPMVPVDVPTNLPVVPTKAIATQSVQESPSAGPNRSASVIEQSETKGLNKDSATPTPSPQISDPAFRNLLIIAAFAPTIVLALMVYILWTVAKERLKSLESEMKETKTQLQKANENLTAVLRLVESKMTLARSEASTSPLPIVSLIPKTQIKEYAGDPGPFKAQRQQKPTN